MRASAALIVVGVGLIGLQVVWPLRLDQPATVSMAPFMLGAILLALGILAGLALGTALYRVAVLVGILGIVVAFFGMTARLHARPDLPVTDPSPNLVIFLLGIGACALAGAMAVAALWRARRTAPS